MKNKISVSEWKKVVGRYKKRFRTKIGKGKGSFYSYPAYSMEIGEFFRLQFEKYLRKGKF